MAKKDLICIGCPLGCMLSVEMREEQVIKVEGNTCPKGEEYARAECTNPTRILTSSVVVEGGKIAMVSIKTETAIPKDRVRACMKELKEIKIAAPINIGDVIIKGVAGTGVNVVATKQVEVK
ncbi:MAG: DUF1667 domain-containing protein [Velocimicrobium sp.]